MSDVVSFLLVLTRWVLGALFVLAAFSKWLNRPGFEHSLKQLRAFPPDSIPIIALGVASLETIVGLALLVNLLSNLFAGLSLLLLSAFTASLVIRVQRGEAEGCGCFGATREKIGSLTFARNAALITLSAAIFIAPAQEWNPWPIPVSLIMGAWLYASRPTRTRSNVIKGKAERGVSPQQGISRRNFLRRLALMVGGILGVSLLDHWLAKPAYAGCPYVQYYEHYYDTCAVICSFEYRIHDTWVRTCDPCGCGCDTNSCCGSWTLSSRTCQPCDDCYRDSIQPCIGCPYGCFTDPWTCP